MFPSDDAVGVDPAAALTALRKAVDTIKAQSPGASDEDAMRLIRARFDDPEAFQAFFTPPPAPAAPPFPREEHMGEELFDTQRPYSGMFAMPPEPLMPPPPPEYPPIWQTGPTRILEEGEHSFSQGIADMTFGEGEKASVLNRVPLGPLGREALLNNILIKGVDDQTIGGSFNSRSAQIQLSAINPPAVFPHELTHAFQSERVGDYTRLQQFVRDALRLADEGNPTAIEGVRRYHTVPDPHKEYAGYRDPQHLYTWFIERELEDPGSLPDELLPYYEGLFNIEEIRAEPAVSETSSTTAEQTLFTQNVLERIKDAGSVSALLNSPLSYGELEMIVRTITHNEEGKIISQQAPDPGTVAFIQSLGIDDAELEEIVIVLMDAGFKLQLFDE